VTSRRQLTERLTAKDARLDKLTAERDAHREDARATAYALEQIAGELSRLKDEVALHIVAAEHPSSALSDARSMALSLREALEAHGVDLRIELARLEGSEL
jgi:hypothetical protein